MCDGKSGERENNITAVSSCFLCGLVVFIKLLDLRLYIRTFDSRLFCFQVTTLGKYIKHVFVTKQCNLVPVITWLGR